MIFSSIPFLYVFLPAFLILYFMASAKLKNTVLLLGSLFFYAWGEQRMVLMLAVTILFGWLFGLWIEKCQGSRFSRMLMWLSIASDLGILMYYKYMDFFIGTVNQIFHSSVPLLKIALPIGISFYTFQILSYTIDVYRGTVPAQKSLISFAAYVSLFPQLIAGPIVRYSDVEKQLENRSCSADQAAAGVKRFILGLGKKVLIANVMGELCVHFRETSDVSVLYYWMYAAAFTLQIYYDFSGYSDMAIGLGKILGFEFMENFRYPYISRSITEFWRRWHISLGSWFRDYVYIPLGGNQKGVRRQLINILIVWALTGLWHGASWNFVIWGLMYAVLLMIEKLGFLSWLKKHSLIGHCYTMLMVVLGFVVFNAESLNQAWNDILGMFGLGGSSILSVESLYYLRSYLVVYLLGVIGATPVPGRLAGRLLQGKERWSQWAGQILEPVFLTGLLLIVTAYLVDGSFNPFLYFRF